LDTDGANYQLDMMRCLREVNIDNNTVGWCIILSALLVFLSFIFAVSVSYLL